VTTPSPKTPVFCRFLANFFLKNREFSTECSVFRKLCRYLAIFRQKKFTVCNVYSEKLGGAFYINFEKVCPSLYIYTCQSTLSNTAVQQGRNEGGKAKDTCPILQITF
jgi:hypothetical protein